MQETPKWIATQQKAFMRWANNHYEENGLIPLVDLSVDFCDGTKLIQLLEIIGSEPLGKYNSHPRMRIQMLENVNTALEFIKHRGIQLHNIGPEDIVDGSQKLILGLLWILILRFTIADINEEGLSAKEGLLLWCQRKTAGYSGVSVTDFSSSWTNGLAFCALIDCHRPDLLDFEELDPTDHKGNTALAFSIAKNQIGIPQLLDAEDIVDTAKPDERALMTYIAYYFHAFSALDKIETAGRRLEKFVETTGSAITMQNSYESRMKKLLEAMRKQQTKWKATESTFQKSSDYKSAKDISRDFTTFKSTTKREWVMEKSELASLLSNIRTKLATYGLKLFTPPQSLSLQHLDVCWSELLAAEGEFSKKTNNNIREIKEHLRKSFANTANEFAASLGMVSLSISELDGELEGQLVNITKLSEQLKPLEKMLETLKDLDAKCTEANVEENDYTVYTYDEQAYEFGLAKQAVVQKLAFIENQIVARSMTNLTPIQLEEFESVFRHFDKRQMNALNEAEFIGALASLGLSYGEEEVESIFEVAADGRDEVSFEKFINFMVKVTEDQLTAEQVLQSFEEVASGKSYVTELDLQDSLIPDHLIAELVQVMPKMEEGYDYKKYIGQLGGV